MVVGINTKYFCIGIHQGDGHAECYDHANMSRYFDIKVMLRLLKNIQVANPQGLMGSIERRLLGPFQIFASSLSTGKIPEDQKVDNDVPLFNPGNYRLGIIRGREALEKFLRGRIYSQLENELIREKQCCCVWGLTKHFEAMIKVSDITRAVDVVYMDFKVFYMVLQL